MRVLGKYFIQAINIECDCGYEEYVLLEDCNFDCGQDCNSVFECPECGKKIQFDLYYDDSVDEELYCKCEEEGEDD